MKVRIVLSLAVVLSITNLSAVIVESNSINAVLAHLDNKETQTLVIFDIDNTLAEPGHVLASQQAFHDRL